jgi:hypothetical protein
MRKPGSLRLPSGTSTPQHPLEIASRMFNAATSRLNLNPKP